MAKVRIMNLTPHPVNLIENGTVVMSFKPEKEPARRYEKYERIGSINGVPINKIRTTIVGMLPEREGTLYIVSKILADACMDRHDLLVPGRRVYSRDGEVEGCESLVMAH